MKAESTAVITLYPTQPLMHRIIELSAMPRAVGRFGLGYQFYFLQDYAYIDPGRADDEPLSSSPGLEHIIMIGIASGCPNPAKPNGDVRLGPPIRPCRVM